MSEKLHVRSGLDTYLVDNINGVVQLLPLQEWMQVRQKVEKVLFSVAVRDEDGYALPRCAVRGLVLSLSHFFVFLLDVLQCQRRLEGQLGRSLCGNIYTFLTQAPFFCCTNITSVRGEASPCNEGLFRQKQIRSVRKMNNLFFFFKALCATLSCLKME